MFDFELMRRASIVADLSELEVSHNQQEREGRIEPESVLEAASPFDDWPAERIAALISTEAESLVVNCEVHSRATYERKYIRPIWPQGESGITIGIGYDVGYHPVSEIKAHWAGLIADRDIELLVSVAGKKGIAARDLLARTLDIVVPWDAAMQAYRRATVPKYGRLVLRAFPNADKVHGHCFGALFSLVFNRGAKIDGSDRRREMREIRTLMERADYDGIPDCFRRMKRHWASTNLTGLLKRRDMEALLFERGVEQMRALPPLEERPDLPPPAVASVTTPSATRLETASDPVLESVAEIVRRDGDGADYVETPPDPNQLETAGSWDAVVWARNDGDSPDYRHITDRSLAGKPFELGWRGIELLLRANHFEPTREHGRIVVCLRGATLVTSRTTPSPMMAQEDREVLTLRDVRPDHKDFRCVIAVYNLATLRVSGFASSTVPNRKAVATYLADRSSGNMMPTGCYRFEVGWHLASKPDRRIPGCLIENGRQKAVLRSINNATYDLADVWEDHRLHGDNLHPAKSEASAKFSSWGCLVVSGDYAVTGADRARGRHTGEWAAFRKAMGWAATGTADHRKEYDVVVLTGLEAAVASAIVEAGDDDRDEIVLPKLGRLRQGSRGERVRRLQKGFGWRETGVMDHAVAKALADRQKKDDNGRSDGIYSPALDERYKLGVFEPLATSDAVVAMGPGGGTSLESAAGRALAAAGSDARLEALYYEIGLLTETARREGGRLESASLESFGATQLEFSIAGLKTVGAGLARIAEDKLREVICGDGTVDRVMGDEVRKQINDYSKSGTRAIRKVLISTLTEVLRLPVPQSIVEKLVDVVIEKVVAPITGPLGQRAVDGINFSAQMMCEQWAARSGDPAPLGAATSPIGAPAAAAATSAVASTDGPPANDPGAASARALPSETTSRRAAEILGLIEDAARGNGTTPDSAGVRRYITQLRDHLAATGEQLAPADNQRFLDILVDSRFMAQIQGAAGADPYQLIDDIETALKAGPQASRSVARLVEDLDTVLSDARVRIQPDTVKRLIKTLRSHKRFRELSLMADRLVTRDPKLLGLVSHAYAQGLIDSGHLVAGIELLMGAVDHCKVAEIPITQSEMAEIDGLLGRAHKQIYVNYIRTPSDAAALSGSHGRQLQLALDRYSSWFDLERAGETYFHGVNYLALLDRADRDRIKVDVKKGSKSEAARAIVRALEPKAADATDPWLLASLGEAYLALGNYDKASEYLALYAKHPHVDAFALNGTVRQLEQVWQLSASSGGAGAILTGLKFALAQKENGFVTLSAEERRNLHGVNSVQFQEKFETTTPGGSYINFGLLKKIVQCGAAVVAVQRRNGLGWSNHGTGFLVNGSEFAPGLSPDTSYIITNAHVIWDDTKARPTDAPRHDQSITPEAARIVFENDQLEGRPASYTPTVLWQSQYDVHDASLIALDRKADGAVPLSLAPASPPLKVTDERTKGTRLSVLGHPLGGSLALSLLGSLSECQATLVDLGGRSRDSSNPVYLHYTTPTESGNSGSPVFETEQWQVVALHHAGYDRNQGRPKLAGRPGTNFANEGIWIESIRQSARAELSRTQSPARKRGKWF